MTRYEKYECLKVEIDAKVSTVTHQGDQDNPISHIHKIEFAIVHSPNAGR